VPTRARCRLGARHETGGRSVASVERCSGQCKRMVCRRSNRPSTLETSATWRSADRLLAAVARSSVQRSAASKSSQVKALGRHAHTEWSAEACDAAQPAAVSASLVMSRQLLLVWHSRTGLARQMANAMDAGARAAARELESPLVVHSVPAANASVADVLRSDGFLFCCPENLASASGEMLEFFHRSYYECLDDTGDETSLVLGRPYALAIAAGSDGSAAARQIERICTGWRLRRVGDTLIHRNGLTQTKANILAAKGPCEAGALARCEELGGLVAAHVLLAESG
jgi:hypothetical protein